MLGLSQYAGTSAPAAGGGRGGGIVGTAAEVEVGEVGVGAVVVLAGRAARGAHGGVLASPSYRLH